MAQIKHNTFDLINAYFRARDEQDTNDEIKFECPLCHGIARGSTYDYNGHIRIECKICEVRVLS